MSGCDLFSIMHYPNVNGGATEQCRQHGHVCALEMLVNWNEHSEDTRLLYQARRLSEMDLM